RDAETHIKVPALRRAREAEGGTTDLRRALAPGAPTHNTNSFAFNSHWVSGTQISVCPQPVLTPLPDIAVHVVEPEPVRSVFSHRRCEPIAILIRDRGIPVLELLLRRPVGHISHFDQGLWSLATVKPPPRPRPAGVLPLGLGRQSYHLPGPPRQP